MTMHQNNFRWQGFGTARKCLISFRLMRQGIEFCLVDPHDEKLHQDSTTVDESSSPNHEAISEASLPGLVFPDFWFRPIYEGQLRSWFPIEVPWRRFPKLLEDKLAEPSCRAASPAFERWLDFWIWLVVGVSLLQELAVVLLGISGMDFLLLV